MKYIGLAEQLTLKSWQFDQKFKQLKIDEGKHLCNQILFVLF